MSPRVKNTLFYAGAMVTLGTAIMAILAAGAGIYRPGAGPGPALPTPQAGVTASPVASLAHVLRDPLGVLLLQLIVIILCARGMGKLFRRIGQPSVIGEVVAGILLGPSLLGWLSPPTQGLLFPAASLDVLRLVSQVGVILFMFTVGVGVDVGHLRRNAHAAVIVSHASIILPFFLGTLLALIIFPLVAPAGASYTAFALFLAVAMSITAFPVLARIVTERGLARSPLGSIAIAAAAVDDVTAWCLLAVVVAISGARGLAEAGLTVALVALFTALIVFVIRPLTPRLFPETGGDHGRVGRISAVLAFALACALFTEAIGIHALFGAFLAGVAMPSTERMHRFVKSRLETITSVMLLPLFFAFTGLRTNVGLIGDWQSLALTAAIIVVAVVGKLAGSSIAARWTGMRWLDALSIGVLMNTRGLVELIALNIGYDLGILTPRMFTMMVLMALVTTFMAGPALALLAWIGRRAPRPAPAEAQVRAAGIDTA